MKIFGVIGDPIEHSMSPAMHNDLFQYYQVDAIYHKFRVEKDQLKEAIDGIRGLKISGVNVTIPHKVNIIPYLDDIEEIAREIGAVNTVVNNKGKLVGYNTDGLGFIEALKPLIKLPLSQSKILLIGAGGAARAIYFTLAYTGVKDIDICNRTKETADYLIQHCKYNANSNSLSIPEAENCLEKYDIIINTTSVGMHPNIDKSPLSLKNIKLDTLVSDIIYNPLLSTFLKDAKNKGATVQNGVGMFVYQGALAFEKWTGISPDTKRMENIVLDKLGGNTIC
ncbi:shikimate dehydrogenase [Bacillus timonensis]|nr:shikimate dehydrogenase [Bacillus timonensis]